MAGQRSMTPLLLGDTTLRDGEQMPGAMLDPADKLAVARALAEAGVDLIEAGFPAVSRTEAAAVEMIAREAADFSGPGGVGDSGGPVVAALCRALQKDIDAADQALADAPAKRRAANIFLSASPLHRRYKLKKSKADVLVMAARAVAYARSRFELVNFSAEDASRTEPEYLARLYEAAITAGATSIGFPDTLGVLTPDEVKHRLAFLRAHVRGIESVLLGAHFHDDLGLATANTLAAVQAGVDMVHCTVGGIGERAGNAALEETAAAVVLRPDIYGRRVNLDATRLAPLCRLVAGLTGVPIPPNKAVCGANAFATGAGIHQDGLLKHPDTYLPYPPEIVGADPARIVLTKHSGRAALRMRLSRMGVEADEARLAAIGEALKNATKAEWADEEGLMARVVGKVSGPS
ncbi:pyruvate carboxyltransferase [Desulfolutivibrio sulfoxidireducens]|uniref:homocitrate synthase/isopropylmalate synthase family protein n=1 Tax=Desulfolutivibrio sulfoxidireducens TaxID=2773299 RepID=UPI00159DED5E|nr:pyruvate carboxyltransferase [Desulfolutivibrio sulfoxidireducens]QLA19291.1 pyruvate carboxyltransferase [Desulfolutivibrio sulfoxidireducens]